MSADALLVIQALFSMIWQFFTSWEIPGTHATPGGFLVFILFASFGIRFLKSFDGGGSSGPKNGGFGSRGGGSGGSGSRG